MGHHRLFQLSKLETADEAVSRLLESAEYPGFSLDPIPRGPVQNQAWGLLTHVTLPGGGKLGIYQPRHARPKAIGAKRRPKKLVKRATKKRRATPK
jgi:hypothetical protein